MTTRGTFFMSTLVIRLQIFGLESRTPIFPIVGSTPFPVLLHIVD